MQIITLLFLFTAQKYIYLHVNKVHAGSFRVFVIHRTLTWTAGSYSCVRDHSCACVDTHRGWAHRRRPDMTPAVDWALKTNYLSIWTRRQRVITTFLTWTKKSQIVLGLVIFGRDSNLGRLWILSATLYQLSHPVTRHGRVISGLGSDAATSWTVLCRSSTCPQSFCLQSQSFQFDPTFLGSSLVLLPSPIAFFCHPVLVRITV